MFEHGDAPNRSSRDHCRKAVADHNACPSPTGPRCANAHKEATLPTLSPRFAPARKDLLFVDRVRSAQVLARQLILEALAGCPGDDTTSCWVERAFKVNVPEAVLESGEASRSRDGGELDRQFDEFVEATFALGVAVGLNVRPDLFER